MAAFNESKIVAKSIGAKFDAIKAHADKLETERKKREGPAVKEPISFVSKPTFYKWMDRAPNLKPMGDAKMNVVESFILDLIKG